MTSKTKSNNENMEVKELLHKNSVAINNLDVKEVKPYNSQNEKIKNPTGEKEKCEPLMKKETFVNDNSNDNYKVKLWGKNINITKSLFTFRLVQILWFGAGSLPSLFLGIFLKQRGLTIVEFSTVYSMIFLFQLITSFITGIITDKIGNAKPVLMFLMLSTSSILLLMSLTPNVNSVTCTQLNINLSFPNSENFSSCYINCLMNNNTQLHKNEKHTGKSSFESVSLNESFDLEINTEGAHCNLSHSFLVNISLDISVDEECCSVCLNNTKLECVSVRNGYLVVAYGILVLAFYSVWSITFRFLDYTSVSFASKHDSHYGKERAFASSGSLLVIVITGFVLTVDKSSGSNIRFDSVIWIAAGLMYCSSLALFTTRVPILPPGKNLLKKGFGLIKDIDVLAFVLVVFVAGNAYTFNYAFHLVYLEFINAPRIVIALHSVAIVLYGFPLLLTSKWWLRKFGAKKLFILGLLSYTVNNTAYSYILNPWFSLVIDITMPFSFHLFWTAVVVHCRNVAPAGFAATLNALTGTVSYGIGRSSGVFFGGMMMSYLGPRKAYRFMAAIFFTSALLYSTFLYVRWKLSPNNATVLYGHKKTDSKHTKNNDSQDV